MSNKPKESKRRGVQVGNFIVTHESGSLKSIKIKSVAGNWNVRYREDNILYPWITTCLKSEEGTGVLHLAISAWFAASNGIPDPEFLTDVVTAYKNSIDRMQERIEKNKGSEEDQTDISSVFRSYNSDE